MGYNKGKRGRQLAAAAVLIGSFIAQAAPAKAQTPAPVKLRILETTDIHSYLLPYDYYKDAPTNEFGFAKAATLIRQARQEAANSVLFDNGDLIQGNPLADYVAKVEPLKPGQVHPVYKALNPLGYDAATLGNHEFNYGLDFLAEAVNDASFPYVNGNIYVDDQDQDDTNDELKYKPYVILAKQVQDENGSTQTLKIGILGLVAPQIMQWDKANLEGKVKAQDIVAAAEKQVPKMRAEGADLVIVLAHTGFDVAAEPYKNAENAVMPLSKVPGIDAVLFGHRHVMFPGAAEFNNMAGVDNVKGTINGVAAVEAGNWGNGLGVIDVMLQKVEDKWRVTGSQAVVRQVYDKQTKIPLAEADQQVTEAVQNEHNATIQYVRSKIGETAVPLYSYFARVQDDPTIQIVNAAQTWYVEQYVNEKLPDYKGVPILSAGAPFRAGRQGPSDFTNIAAGELSIKSANDLYLYPNTLKAVELTGAEVKEWLEMSASQFNQINPESTEPQPLITAGFEPFNFDVMDGVYYDIDITQPAKYKPDGTVWNANAQRIKNLRMPNGTAVSGTERFLVVTNNYRASGGGNFPGLAGGKAKVVVDSADENRQVLIDYIQQLGKMNAAADQNWRIAPIPRNVMLTFQSSPDAASMLTQNPAIKYVSEVTDDKGIWGLYALQTYFPALTVETVRDNDNKLRGQTVPRASVTVQAGTKVLGMGKADAEGEILITIPKQNIGTVLTITASDKGVDSKPVTVQVKSRIAVKDPEVRAIKSADTSISGSAEPGMKIMVKKASEVIGTGTADQEGRFQVEMKKQRRGTELYIYAADKDGNMSKGVKKTVK
ncbi:bifunctional 2',3'-cyclic-nucleotide 2'-phosphodiesterase/3'-nucleotidase [Ectobacillus ponti]|uniref:Bifunctional 2',3'-cyclic-nucleotide 2'-phosphodiesterase/3'-nucleotidase n=1 Tax=Ectobacillus ponti TaxID=2961894 RepID=A0AA41X4I6_9BACI|nr:bifunctional 2',3'-cyclic-nucleotide 2'-phosphodiesterase/3'-nucleotidase [Ectobacillus ponti]MCP8968597.1 bifunctional 2',3'-cyclic-nucleotide 2'-phosphodiesterase/3'-nucleotidase [Ectobacillus ponti]